MFSASGIHGPVLTPYASMLLDVIFVAAAILLFWTSKPNKMQSYVFAAFVLIVVAGRVVLQPFPNVQPVTVAVLLMGAFQGMKRGISFAILVTLLSNLFIGAGWWTLFQVAGWSCVAIIGAISAQRIGELQLPRLVYLSVVSAIAFDFIVTFSLVDSTTTILEFLSFLYLGLPYDVLHILSNVTFMIWFGHSIQEFLAPIPEPETETMLAEGLHVFSR